MSESTQTAAASAATGQKKHGRLARFFLADHRYVFLGTSVIALVGLWCGNQRHSDWSILASSYAVESVLYYALLAWVVISLVALVNKLIKWRDYAATSPFKKPRAMRIERICSYFVWVIAAIFVIDRGVLGLCSVVASSIALDSNPQDFLASTIYMVYNSRAVYLQGIITTIELALFGTIIAFFLALLLVFLRMLQIDRQDNDFIRFWKVIGQGFARIYSTIVRGTPMMVQGLIIYFAGYSVLRGTGMSVSEIGGIWSTFVASLTTISLNSTAYMMEVLRGGIESVDKGQTEAARSLGLSQWQAMSKVVFPQGIKNSIPALSNELVINIKDSSVLSVIGVVDLMFATTTIAGIYYKQMEIYVMTALVYLLLTAIASKLLTMLSHRLEVKAPGPVLGTSDVPVSKA
ncbi:MAG: amino acid ABC transporter permease [Tractidigestivibacter sp.]|uniref:amino acid ABC transporter permease n=1 Tax=Tractidigestivibacter sp. TaxID=2847320 RepID=UPI003D939C82